jgi:hypothetical protein
VHFQGPNRLILNWYKLKLDVNYWDVLFHTLTLEFSDNSIPSFTCFIPIWPLLRKTLTSRVRNKQTYVRNKKSQLILQKTDWYRANGIL